ncbi:MAG: hypothetical protein ON057_001091 [Glomeribacter sp. 1016415]|nr:hypothetical protein [Glomeribacter sp. 1016415]
MDSFRRIRPSSPSVSFANDNNAPISQKPLGAFPSSPQKISVADRHRSKNANANRTIGSNGLRPAISNVSSDDLSDPPSDKSSDESSIPFKKITPNRLPVDQNASSRIHPTEPQPNFKKRSFSRNSDGSSYEFSDVSSCETSDEPSRIQQTSESSLKRKNLGKNDSSKRLCVEGHHGIGKSPTMAQSSLDSVTLAKIHSEILNTFPERLTQLLECDRGQRSVQQARAKWNLPDEHRFMAAFFDCTWQAGKKFGAQVTTDTTDIVLQQALRAVRELEQKAGSHITTLLADPDLFHLRTLVASPDKFAPRANETARIFAQVADDIQQCSGYPIAADQMWRLCIDPQTIALLEKCGIDVSNPLLGYLFDSQPGYLYRMACGWQCVMQRVQSRQAPNAEFLIELNQACTGRDDDEMDVDEMEDAGGEVGLPQNSTGLETDDVEFGLLRGSNLSEAGEQELRKTAAALQPFNITLDLKDDGENTEYSRQFGQRFLTLVRKEANQHDLIKALQHWFSEYKKEIKMNGVDLALAEVKLARRLDQTHAFADANVRSCHLLLNCYALMRGQPPFMFADPNILDGCADVELQTAREQAQAIRVTAVGSTSPLFGIEATGEMADKDMEGNNSLIGSARLPRRKARVEENFPFPLTEALKTRLRQSLTKVSREIKKTAVTVEYGGKGLMFFARQVMNQKDFTKLKTKQPGELWLYAASFPERNGGKSINVALLMYVEGGCITDIRIDTPVNREQIGIALRNPVQEAIANGESYDINYALSVYLSQSNPPDWINKLGEAAQNAGYSKKSMLKFVRDTVVKPGLGRKETGLPEGVLLYDYPSKEAANKVTLVARVENNQIQRVQLDNKAGRDKVIANAKRGDLSRMIANGELYDINPSLSSSLGREDPADWIKALRRAAQNARYPKKSMLEFVRDVVKPGLGREDAGLPEDALLYDYPSKEAANKVTLVARVENNQIQRVQLDNEAGRDKVIANTKPGDLSGMIANGEIYDINPSLRPSLGQEKPRGWVKALGEAAQNVGYSKKSMLEFIRKVVKPGLGREDAGLPAGVLLYDYPSKEAANKVTLVARVENNQIQRVQLDNEEGRDKVIANTKRREPRKMAATRKSYAIGKFLSNVLDQKQSITWVNDLLKKAQNAGYTGKSMLPFVQDIVKPGLGRADAGLPEGVLLYDYPSSEAANKVTLVALVVDNKIQSVQLNDKEGRDAVIAKVMPRELHSRPPHYT